LSIHSKYLKLNIMLLGSLSKMDGMETARGFYGMNPNKSPFLGMIVHSYYFLVGAGAIPARLYLRKNMGERAFSPFAFLLSFGFFAYYGIYPDDDFMLLGGSLGILGAMEIAQNEISVGVMIFINIFFNTYLLFLWWLIRQGIRHFKQVLKKSPENRGQYSYFRGEGKYFEHRLGGKMGKFNIDERFIRMVIEPLALIKYGFCLLIGSAILGVALYFLHTERIAILVSFLLIIFGWIHNLGFAIIFSGLCLFLEEFGIMMRIRGAALDIIDGEYDMAFILKKKEELQSGKIEQQNNLALAEEIFQGNTSDVAHFESASLPDEKTDAVTKVENENSKEDQSSADTQTLHEKLRDQFLKSN